MSPEQPLRVDLATLGELAREAGALAFSYFGQVVAQQKADNSLVSEADKAVETFLTKQLSKLYPDTAVLGEEYGHNDIQSPHLWILDPIDGTAAYLGGYPSWGVSIGYMFQKTPIAGVFYLPVSDDLFIGSQQEAYWDQSRLVPNITQTIDSNSVLLVPSNIHRRYHIKFIGKTRSLGSVAAHLSYLAAGKAAGAILGRPSLWDIAGVFPILQATGIEIHTIEGQPLLLETLLQNNRAQQVLLAAPQWYMAELVESVSLS